MISNKPDKNYSADDFQNYYNGTMSSTERNALEKAALDDPFLAEALEGYKYSKSAPIELQSLRTIINNKQKRRTGTVIFNLQSPFLRIAALLVIFLGAGWLVYILSLKPEEEIAKEVVQTGDKEKMEDSINDNSIVPTFSLADSAYSENSKITEQSSTGLAVKTRNATGKVTTVGTVSKPNDNVQVGNTRTLRAVELNNNLSTNLVSGPRVQNNYRGRVIDEAGNAVPFATINTTTNQATVTDVAGNFNLLVQDTILKANVSALGYNTQQLFLTPSSVDTTVILQHNEDALHEVVVTAYGNTKRRQVVPLKKEEGYLEPSGGWSNFNEYLTENLKMPEELGEPSIRGEVTLSFDVDDKGAPVNIKIEKSLCSKCDEEAIRILKQGPKWKKANRKRGKLNIKF